MFHPETFSKILKAWVALGILLSVAGCGDVGLFPHAALPPTAIAPTPALTIASTQAGTGLGWLKVYFTNPKSSTYNKDEFEQMVVKAVEQAHKSIDVTSFDLNLPDFVNALVAARQRGVQVRVVYDGVNGNQLLEASKATGKEFNAVLTMKSAGIPLVNAGRNSGLMHNKFILIDGQILFTGSWNMSYNDTFRNNNNLLEITDPTLIANYQAKFDDLYLKKHFGARSRVGALVPEVSIGGVKVDNYFSPTDPVMKKLLALVNGATKSIHFMAYTFTDQDLANALIARYQQGLDVQGVIESRSVVQSSLPDLFCARVPVKEDGNAYNMHHKVLIIDDHIVVTGSFNFTESADSINDENVLVIDSPQVAQQYLAEFDRVNAIAKTPTDITCK